MSIRERKNATSISDQIALNVVKKLEDTGLVIVSSVIMEKGNGDFPEFYYEVMSRAGDIFLISVPTESSLKTNFYGRDSNRVINGKGSNFSHSRKIL